MDNDLGNSIMVMLVMIRMVCIVSCPGMLLDG